MTIEELTKMLHTQMDLLGRVLAIVEDQERRLISLETAAKKRISFGGQTYDTVQDHNPWAGYTPHGIVVVKDEVVDTWGISENDVDKEDLQ